MPSCCRPFRTPETNAMLARTTFGVAENSQHLYGRALDVRFAARLPDAVVVARAMRRGGVGWYPHSGFVHLDTGPVRNWDLDEQGLQDLLITGRSTPGAPALKGEILVNGPGTLIVGGHKPPVVLAGRVCHRRANAADCLIYWPRLSRRRNDVPIRKGWVIPAGAHGSGAILSPRRWSAAGLGWRVS
jgi:hypothetical protein